MYFEHNEFSDKAGEDESKIARRCAWSATLVFAVFLKSLQSSKQTPGCSLLKYS